LRYRYRLFRSGAPLKQDAHIGLSFAPTFNPSLTRLGPTVVIKPLAVVAFKFGYLFNIWHGQLGNLQSFEYVEEDYFTADWDFETGGREAYATIGHELLMALDLIIALGPFALSNQLEASLSHHDLKDADQLFYSPRYDVLATNGGWVISNDTDVVFITSVGLVAGLRGSVVHAVLQEDDFREGTEQRTDATPTIALGPLVSYVFFDRPTSRLNKPTLFLIVGWWLKHPYRTGIEVHQAVPVVSFGLALEGELWSRD
jgi:hypothetical protein